MANNRFDVKVSISPEALAHANQRADELGCSRSALVEALLRADMAQPVAGLAARVAAKERETTRGRSARGAVTIESAREKRWPKPTE